MAACRTQTNIPVKKPGKKNYFRVHPDPSYRLYDVGVIEEDGGDVYLVNADLRLPDDVMQFVSRANLLTALTHRGKARWGDHEEEDADDIELWGRIQRLLDEIEAEEKVSPPAPSKDV